MRIILNIMGSDLYEKITKEMAVLHSPFPKRYKHGKVIDWQLRLMPEVLSMNDLTNHASDLNIILIDAHDVSMVERLRALERQEFLYVNAASDFPHGATPIIVVFQSDALIPKLLELPEVVTDWMIEPISMHDLVRRIFVSLRRKKLLQTELRFGKLTLLPESRKLCFSGDAIQLMPSELAIAELFLHHFGSVILLEDIILMFKLSGRSTENSNIRVTMFQLRFKIEAITRCQFTLVSVYKEGYSLRNSRNYDTDFPFPDLEVRQETAVYTA